MTELPRSVQQQVPPEGFTGPHEWVGYVPQVEDAPQLQEIEAFRAFLRSLNKDRAIPATASVKKVDTTEVPIEDDFGNTHFCDRYVSWAFRPQEVEVSAA